MIDVKAIEERCEKATKGPWATHLVDDTTVVADGKAVAETAPEGGIDDDVDYDLNWEQREADADFIAHARQDIPDLLAENADLRRQITALQWRELESAPNNVPIQVKQGDWVCTAKFHRDEAVGHWTDGASILHYNGTILVPGFRFSPHAKWRPFNAQEPQS